MIKIGVSANIKTPHKTKEIKNLNNAGEQVYTEIENLVYEMLMKKTQPIKKQMAAAAVFPADTFVRELAEFFQKLCARTPLDDKYKWTDEEGNHYHYPDKDYCRYQWILSYGGTSVTSNDLYVMDSSIFDTEGDPGSIETIRTCFLSTFGKIDGKSTFSLSNPCKHYRILEYGGFKMASSSIIKYDANGRPHGISNSHSIQAPSGMLRLSLMELSPLVKKYLNVNA